MQLFAIVKTPDGDSTGSIPNGAIVEIVLENGLDGFIDIKNTEDVPVLYKGNAEYIFKDWLCQYWVV